FAIWSFVEGETVQSRSDLDRLDAPLVQAVADALIESFAALHQVDYLSVGLEAFGRPDGYFERQVSRWSRQWEIVAPKDLSAVAAADQLSTALMRRVPAQLSATIVHGDFRIDNALLSL